jgi:hypothetical protein
MQPARRCVNARTQAHTHTRCVTAALTDRPRRSNIRRYVWNVDRAVRQTYVDVSEASTTIFLGIKE